MLFNQAEIFKTEFSGYCKTILFYDALQLNVVFTLRISFKVRILGIIQNISMIRDPIKLKFSEQNSLAIPK